MTSVFMLTFFDRGATQCDLLIALLPCFLCQIMRPFYALGKFAQGIVHIPWDFLPIFSLQAALNLRVALTHLLM